MSDAPPNSHIPHMTAPECAAYLRLSVRQLQRLRRVFDEGGNAPPYRRAGHRRVIYITAEVDAWIRDGGDAALTAATGAPPRIPPIASSRAVTDLRDDRAPDFDAYEPDPETDFEPPDPDTVDADFDPSEYDPNDYAPAPER